MADANATTPLASRSPQTVALDNLLRRELRLSDPYQPDQIATALLGRYPTVKDQMARERAGFAYSDTPDAATPVGPTGGATTAEIGQASDDLDRDLTTLTTSSELKDIQVELMGWSRAVRQAVCDGLAAGSLALDVNQYDRAMSARRILGDYARLSRYVGVMFSDTSPFFRRFAQSCDVMAGLILVAMGEGLAANGVTRGSALIRVAAGELQSRRNAVIYALRNLTGTVEGGLGQNDWPRGMEAYRSLIRYVEESGQTDLRTLLDESALAAALDQLVDLAAGATGAGLRELSTASTMLVQRLAQLVQFGESLQVNPGARQVLHSPEAPALAAFISALKLFNDAFREPSSGRLLYLARPAIITYGLYGMAGPDVATQRLINIAIARGQLAEQIDSFANFLSNETAVGIQVLLDLVLYRLDRAIDLYAVGRDPYGHGAPEVRAASTGYLINTVVTHFPGLGGPLNTQLTNVGNLLFKAFNPGLQLSPGAPLGPPKPIAAQELQLQYQAEEHIERLVYSLSPIGNLDSVFRWNDPNNGKNLSVTRFALQLTLGADGVHLPSGSTMPATIEESLDALVFKH